MGKQLTQTELELTNKDTTMESTSIVFSAPLSPYVTVQKFSDITGIAIGQVNKMLHEGRLPIRPKTPGKPKEKPLINMLALVKEADSQVF